MPLSFNDGKPQDTITGIRDSVQFWTSIISDAVSATLPVQNAGANSEERFNRVVFGDVNSEPVFKRTWDAETMDLPVVEYSEQKRPSLKANAVSGLIGHERRTGASIVRLAAATGMRISEVLGLEVRHIINDGRTVRVEQQVEKDRPKIVKYLRTNASKREIGLHPDVAEFLRQ